MRKHIVLGLALSFALTGCSIEIADTHFFHPGASSAKPASFPRTAEDVEINGDDGARLRGVYVRRPDAAVDVLYFGGDSFTIDEFGPEIEARVSSIGANLFMIDYRGYGRSGGVPTLPLVKADALAAFDALRARNEGRPIVVHGFSMGSFIAAYVAAERPASGLALESTATTVKDWARAQIPAYAKPFVRLRIAPLLLEASNVQALSRYCGPLLLVTGERDAITPSRFARSLFQSSCTPLPQKRVVIAPDTNHGDAFTNPIAISAYGDFVCRVAQRGNCR
jgi:fermentation-respiration switch protein FrsA (DUF1100 family)